MPYGGSMQQVDRGSSILSDYAQDRHTRREAGIQCHGWQAQTHPWSLGSGNPCRNDDLET